MKHVIFVLLLFVLFACGNTDYGETEAASDFKVAAESRAAGRPAQPTTAIPPADGESAGRTTSPTNNRPQNQKIIYTGSIRMQVDSLADAVSRVTSLVNRAGGYVSNQNITDNRYEKEAQLTIRLPVEGFQPSMQAITELATFVNAQQLDSRDVTAQWIDLESRLGTKREVRKRYIDILRNRAKKVEDILAAEEKIRQITEEIEAREGQLRYLRDQVGLSTLSLMMYETREVSRPEPETVRYTFLHEIGQALGAGGFFMKQLLLVLVGIWPLYLLIPVGVWAFRRWRK